MSIEHSLFNVSASCKTSQRHSCFSALMKENKSENLIYDSRTFQSEQFIVAYTGPVGVK